MGFLIQLPCQRFYHSFIITGILGSIAVLYCDFHVDQVDFCYHLSNKSHSPKVVQPYNMAQDFEASLTIVIHFFDFPFSLNYTGRVLFQALVCPKSSLENTISLIASLVTFSSIITFKLVVVLLLTLAEEMDEMYYVKGTSLKSQYMYCHAPFFLPW